jgi:hypothetical protein
MEEKVIKELQGHSGSKVYLIQDSEKLFVRKIGNVARNVERLQSLSGIVNVPKIYSVSGDILDMEYIHGLDMKTYLSYNNPDKLIDFFLDSIDTLLYDGQFKDYTQTYHQKLENIDFGSFPFTKKMLIDRLPRMVFSTKYLGDLTLENILYDMKADRFVFIDLITSEYDSIVFDLAKLNQDLICKWFVRHEKYKAEEKLLVIRQALQYINITNEMNILMLLRVLPYCKNDFDKQYIINEVNKLWM